MKEKGINNLKESEIKVNLDNFLKKQGDPKDRYASFDYCFNYFQDFKDRGKLSELKNEENMQLSCLHLGLYLASWGMYRGSTFLLQRSMKVYEELIRYIADDCNDLWNIDVHNYGKNENISKLTKCEEMIREKLGRHNFIKADGSELNDRESTQTLTTKIMLGVFGNVPAFDQYFVTASGLRSFNKNSLLAINKFYNENNKYINEWTRSNSDKIRTHNFHGEETKRVYTKAKLIDMIFFQKGLTEGQRTKQKRLKEEE